MRAVEEMAGFISAKSGEIAKTYLNGMLTENEKHHLNIYFEEAVSSFDEIAQEYPHRLIEREFEISMPMNFDEHTSIEVAKAVQQYFALYILRHWEQYIATNKENVNDNRYAEKLGDYKIRIKALLNHRKRPTLAHFERTAGDPKVGFRIKVQ